MPFPPSPIAAEIPPGKKCLNSTLCQRMYDEAAIFILKFSVSGNLNTKKEDIDYLALIIFLIKSFQLLILLIFLLYFIFHKTT